MIDIQIAFMRSLEKQQAFDKSSAVLFGKIKDNATISVGQSQLTWARNKDFISYIDKEGLKYYFLSKKGIKYLNDFVDRSSTKECTDEPQCHASAGGDAEPDMTGSMLEDPANTDSCLNCTQDSCSSCGEAKPIPLPQYNPDYVAFDRGADVVEFIVVDSNGDQTCAPFEIMTDAIDYAHHLASIGGEYTVIRKTERKIGTAKPITTTQWVLE